MATTWIKPVHSSKSMGNTPAIAAIIGYVENPEKTDNGRLISSYSCDSRAADYEFTLAKNEYEYITGRSQGRRNIIAYHIRQAFKPGEVDPETANKIGYDLAMSLTKGNHAFVVCTHIDKAHIHNHIIFNSTSLSCDRKFKNFFFSNRAIRRISDLLCVENGLSIIENPQPTRGGYEQWLGDNRQPTWQCALRNKIDETLPSCKTFEEFLAAMRAAGYTVNTSRKYISFLAPGQKRPTRMKSLGEDYSEEAIRSRLGIGRVLSDDSDSGMRTKINLLIDIQTKIQEGKGKGYEQWAKIFNLKESAKTLVWLKENGIDSYDDLVAKASAASGKLADINKRLREIEQRQKEIATLQRHIGTYSKTREIYAQYRASGWSRDFYDVHSADIILHRAAKKHFDELVKRTEFAMGKGRKLPTISQLKQEYAELSRERNAVYSEYHAAKKSSCELSIALANAQDLLDIKPIAQSRSDRQNSQPAL